MVKTIPFLLLLLPVCACAQNVKQKTHTLFHATPRVQLREMETDRPDVTESAITVDAGHFQLETDLIATERKEMDAGRQQMLYINRANLKLGLLSNTSLQIGFETFVVQNEKKATESKTEQGLGDINIRLKQNIHGNDKGNFAIAVIPFIKFPTAAYTDESKLEGGLIVPLQLKLPHDWKLGFQLEMDRLKNDEDKQMHTEFLQSLTISHDLLESVTGIAETYYTYDFAHHHFSNYLNAAVQVEVLRDCKIDAGINYGIQKDAVKKYFLGLSFRI